MRRIVLALSLLLAASCGGGSDTTTPPPPAPVVTSLLVDAGDNQSADVGTSVATPPGALVKDQYGNPMPGVTVTFAVEQGGGSITGAVATTASDGKARDVLRPAPAFAPLRLGYG